MQQKRGKVLICLPMVIGTNSMPTTITNLGCGKEGNFIQCRTAQYSHTAPLGYENSTSVKQPWARPPSGYSTLLCTLLVSSALCCSAPLCSGLLHAVLVCSGLHWLAPLCSGKTSLVFKFSRGNAVFSGKGKWALIVRKKLTQIEVPCPWPYWPVLSK